MAQLTIEIPDVFADIPPILTKEILMHIVDELPTEQVTELLEFALFMKARQMKYAFQIDSYVEEIISQQKENIGLLPNSYPLQGSVLFYDDPYEPIAESDWEILQ